MRTLRFIALAILTLLLALLFVRFPSPPRADLDSAWSMALLYAYRHGLQFGRDIIFTFGPLGFLVSNVYYDGVPQIRFLWEIFGKLAFAATAVAIGASFGWPRFIYYYASLILGALMAPELFTAYGVPLLALCWLLPRNTKTWQIIVAVIWMAIFSAIRLNYCTLAIAALGILCVRDFLRKEWRRPLAIVVGYVFVFLLLWILAGQQVRNLPVYFANSWEISNGYLSAMFLNQLPAIGWWLGAALWLVIGAFLVSLLWRKKIAEQKWTFLYLFIAWFFIWKHGFTRADDGHISLFFPAAAVLFSAAAAGFGEQRRWTFLDLAPAICFVGLALCRPGFFSLTPQIFSERVRQAAAQAFRPQAYLKRFAAGEREDKNLHGKPDLVEIVGQETIDVINYDQDEVLREHLNFHPRPVFQSYSAFTPTLLQGNLHFYEGKNAPRFVFARLQTVDGRYPAQDDSLLLEELPRRFSITRRAGDYLLLRRRHEQPLRPLGREKILQREVAFGEEIAVSSAENCAMELRAAFQPSLYGRLRSFLVQPTQIKIVLIDQQNKTHSGRIIPAMAAAGFLVQPLLESQEDFARFLDAQAENLVTSIRFEPDPGTAKCWSRITVELFRLPEVPISTRAAEASP